MDGHALGASTGRALGARVLQARFLQTTAVAGVAHPLPHGFTNRFVTCLTRYLPLVGRSELISLWIRLRVALWGITLRVRLLVTLLRRVTLLWIGLRVLRILCLLYTSDAADDAPRV